MAGYSGTPLVRKLGIAPGHRVYVKGSPVAYEELVAPLPPDVRLLARPGKDLDLIHFFTSDRRELEQRLPGLQERLVEDGCLWISWPKKSSGRPSTVTEDVVREIALPRGLVDVKVCAVDEVWSGLKLVLRKELRSSPKSVRKKSSRRRGR